MSYLEDRIQPRLAWYDRRAVRCKQAHFAIEFSAALLTIGLVLLIDIETVPRIFLSSIAAGVAILLAIAKIGRFGEKWQLYRLAAEALASEVQLMLNKAGPYARDPASAERLLVERVEGLLSHEALVWRRYVKPGAHDVPKIGG